MQKALYFNDLAIVSVKGNDCRILFWYLSKGETMNWLRNPDLIEKRWNITKHKNLLPHIKFGDTKIEKHKFQRYLTIQYNISKSDLIYKKLWWWN